MPRLDRLPAPRILFAGTGLVAIGLVVGGVILAQTLNLAACPLCVLQRMLYLLLAVLSFPGLLFAGSGPWRRGFAAVMTASALTGVWIAAYQTWLQRFAKGVSCTADQPWWEEFVNWAGSLWPLMFEGSGSCSEAGWKLLGLSIAEWSLIAFSAMAVAMVLAFRQRRDTA